MVNEVIDNIPARPWRAVPEDLQDGALQQAVTYLIGIRAGLSTSGTPSVTARSNSSA